MEADASFPERADSAEWAQLWVMFVLVVAIMVFGRNYHD